MSLISDRQKRVLEFIKQNVRNNGYPPSVREICKAVGLRSTSTVHGHLEKLEKNGYIRRDPSKPRAIEIIDGSTNRKDIINVPIVGNVTAGEPILAVENIEDTFPLPLDFAKDENVFILRIKGESMIDAGILDRDYVLVRQQPNAKNGDIVVALIENEATVKVFYKENDYIRLQPRNQFMDPIILTDVMILGKVIGVFRSI